MALVRDYPLAFSSAAEESASFAEVAPIRVDINPGAKPVCRTICPRDPAGIEKFSKQLIYKLLRGGIIKHWDKQSQ